MEFSVFCRMSGSKAPYQQWPPATQSNFSPVGHNKSNHTWDASAGRANLSALADRYSSSSTNVHFWGGVKNAVYNNSALVERFNGQLFQPCYGMAVMLCLMLNLLEFQRFARRYANSPRRSSDGGGGGGSAAVVSPTSPSRPSSPPNRLPSSLNPEGSVFGWSGPGNIDDGGVRERRPPVRQVNLWRKK